MCDIFSSIIHTDKKHDIASCPIRAALYCNVCQVYGHSIFKCPDKNAWRVRVPEYQEQLIPLRVREQYKITTKTPIVSESVDPIECPYPPVIEIPEDKDGKSVRAMLTSLQIPVSGVKENRRVFEAYAALIGKKVVYLQNEQGVKEKVKIKIKKVQTVQSAKTEPVG